MSLEQWVVVSRSSLAKHGVLVLRLLRLALELHVLGCILVVRGIVERRLGRLGGMRDCGLGCHCCCCHCLGRLLPLPGGSGYWLASRGTSSCAPTSSAATRYVVIIVIVLGLVVVVVLRLFIVNVELVVVIIIIIIVISALSLRVVVVLVIVVGFGALGSTASARRGRLALGSAPLLGTTAS